VGAERQVHIISSLHTRPARTVCPLNSALGQLVLLNAYVGEVNKPHGATGGPRAFFRRHAREGGSAATRVLSILDATRLRRWPKSNVTC